MQMIRTFNEEPKKLTITEIESFTENDAFDAAEDTAEIKEHAIYFVDMGGAFGYSVLGWFMTLLRLLFMTMRILSIIT